MEDLIIFGLPQISLLSKNDFLKIDAVSISRKKKKVIKRSKKKKIESVRQRRAKSRCHKEVLERNIFHKK